MDADFGMTTCPHCEAVFMVEIDGSVNDPVVEEQSAEELVFADNSLDTANDSADEVNVEAGAGEIEPEFQQNDSTDDSYSDSPSFDEVSSDDGGGVDERFSLDESNEESSDEAEVSGDPLKDPLDLQRFDESGGSEISDGELLYDIILQGLDSAELKKDIFAALMDKRFALSAEEMRRGLKSGILTLSSVNPVRAMLIVLKMQEFDVTIEWRQRHFTQPSKKVEEPSP